jgi:hypothetical protein
MTDLAVHDGPIFAFTMADLAVHDGPIFAFTMARNPQASAARTTLTRLPPSRSDAAEVPASMAR